MQENQNNDTIWQADIVADDGAFLHRAAHQFQKPEDFMPSNNLTHPAVKQLTETTFSRPAAPLFISKSTNRPAIESE